MKSKKQISINIINSLIPILIAFSIGAVIILAIGKNPLTVYKVLFNKSLLSTKGFLNTLHYAAPLILTGLAIAITFKANIFNMGVEGQLLFGAFFSGVVGSSLSIQNSLLHKLICFGVGSICGMAFALVPAILRAKYKVDEMVVTLTLNYAMIKILEFLASGPFRDAGSGYVSTKPIEKTAMFNRLGNSRITMFFFIVIIIFILVYVLMKKSVLGFEIGALGKNPEFAEATGMNISKKIIILMLISGALSGIAGSGYMMSEKYQYTLGFSGSPGLGWDGMLIALLGRHSPLGIFLAAIFYSMLKTGADSINVFTSVPKEVVSIIQAIIILFLAVRFIDEKYGLKNKIKAKFSKTKIKEEA